MEDHRIQRNFYLARLITEELAGTISSDRRRELEEWLGQSEGNRLMYRELRGELADAAVHPLAKIDTARAWVAMQEKQGRRRKTSRIHRIRRWAVAASVAVLLGGAASFYFYSVSVSERPEQLVQIVPGSARARLILAEGEVIQLEQINHDEFLNSEPGVTIRMDSGRIVYTADPKTQSGTVNSNTLIIPRGGEYSLQLSDGTRVWLNSATTLKYPPVFSGKQRQVELEGEAYFEVAHNAESPFIVKTPATAVQVYGTSFNVYAYAGEDCQYTTLLKGSIGVGWKGQEVRLQPGEQAVLDIRKDQMSVHPVNAASYCSWHTGTFVFENNSLREVLDRLSRWYDVEVFYVNPEVQKLHFTGDLNRYDGFEKILRFLEMTHKVQFFVQGKTIRVCAK